MKLRDKMKRILEEDVDKEIIEVTLDLHNETNKKIELKQADHNSHILKFYLTKGDETPVRLHKSRADLYIRKSDNKIVVIEGNIINADNGEVDFSLTRQALAVLPSIDCEVVKTGLDGSTLSFPLFSIGVKDSIYDCDEVESSNEFSALVDALNKVETIDTKYDEKFEKKINEFEDRFLELKGDDGLTPSIQIGTVTTLEPGEEVTVTRSGTNEEPILNFGIPRGEDGLSGDGAVFIGKPEEAPNGVKIVIDDEPSPYDLFFENANVDYMGNTYTSLKEKADADIEYLLRKFGTQHYEGTSITATDTYMKRVKSAMFKGQTLVNILGENEFPKTLTYGSADFIVGQEVTTSTTYTIVANLENVPDSDNLIGLVLNGGGGTWGSNAVSTKNGINSYLITTNTVESNPNRAIRVRGLGTTVKWVMIFKGDYTKQDIPYFEGMQSTKSPVLTTFNTTNLWCVSELLDETEVIGGHTLNISKFISVEPGETIYFNQNVSAYAYARFYSKDEIQISQIQVAGHSVELGFYSKSYHVVPENAQFMKILVRVNLIDKMMVNRGNDYLPYEEGKRYEEVILTTPQDLILRGVGDVHDTLDLNTGEYIERTFELDVNLIQDEDFSNYSPNGINGETPNCGVIFVKKANLNKYFPKYSGNKVPVSSFAKAVGSTYGKNYECVALHSDDNQSLQIKLSNERLNGEYTREKAIEVIRTLGIKMVCVLETPIKKTVDLKGQKVYSYDGTTHYTTKSLDGHPAPILSIDVPTNTPKMIARQRETIEHQEQKMLEQEEVQNILIESQLAWYEQTLLSTLDLPNKKQLPTHIQKLYEVAYKRGIRTQKGEL